MDETRPDYRRTLSKIIADAALQPTATDTDRLAAAVMLLAMEINEASNPPHEIKTHTATVKIFDPRFGEHWDAARS